MLLTLPGIPLIYTGDEYGLEFEPYQQLELLEFKEAYSGLRDYHRRLIELRKEITSLHSRQWEPITPDAVPQAVFSYIRYGEESDPPVIVLLNFSEEPAELEFDIPAEFGDLPGDGILYDLLAGESLTALDDGRVRVSVPAQTARILAAQPLT
jgi:glycosidase